MTTAKKFALRSFSRFRIYCFVALLTCVPALLSIPANAQQRGPLPPPTSSGASSGSPGMSNSGAVPINENAGEHSESAITNEPPSIPADQVIQKFSQHESEFKTERDNSTYTHTFVIQT